MRRVVQQLAAAEGSVPREHDERLSQVPGDCGSHCLYLLGGERPRTARGETRQLDNIGHVDGAWSQQQLGQAVGTSCS